MPTPCFFLEPTSRHARKLRRFTYSDDCPCPGRVFHYNGADHLGGHEASVPLDIVDEASGEETRNGDLWPHDDPRWPTHCEGCGEWLSPDVKYQLFVDRLYEVTDSLNEAVVPGLLFALREVPPGGMYYADWMQHAAEKCVDSEGNEIGCHYHLGPDGKVLVAVCPDGHAWTIDSRASNCTLPNDNEHACWVREGVPPRVTAGKEGKTCSAGAGSIATGNYHGFLRDGVFT